MSAGEVRGIGMMYKIKTSQTKYNWNVFDFSDRTRRFLDRLVRKKVTVYKKVGRRHYYNLR